MTKPSSSHPMSPHIPQKWQVCLSTWIFSLFSVSLGLSFPLNGLFKGGITLLPLKIHQFFSIMILIWDLVAQDVQLPYIFLNSIIKRRYSCYFQGLPSLSISTVSLKRMRMMTLAFTISLPLVHLNYSSLPQFAALVLSVQSQFSRDRLCVCVCILWYLWYLDKLK